MTTTYRPSALEAWCRSCFGFVPLSDQHRCLHCGNPVTLIAVPASSDRFCLTWQEPSRKRSTRPLGRETYVRSMQADLWQQAQSLIAQGYSVTITPAALPVVDADAYEPEASGAIVSIDPL